ncbi:Malonyl CoA-acyl carrier protein transacylase [Suttonella ornithocola]|uniref:Malonyl CoA-acyl carrier protein transacylase n=2 Tax=Suttonella ornithocola TaxID=279832 RepID=A0A380N0Y2_9GAMM|nr:ACP S-malonyltransferase [Suttonella ornithocola]SUO97946.1 Malonyl CoA-acyl carrier protein transacylase [Suttonella ornithocola]
MSIALIFPGQGSQSVGMMKAFSEQYSLVKERFQEASDIVGYNLWDLTQNNTDNFLNRTEYTQPIILTASIAALEILRKEISFTPNYMAGHSLGEYTALCAAGALSFAEAIHLVHTRGKLMQEAVPHGEGAMAAILGLKNATVSKICGEVEGEVYPANFNAPEQVVIGGRYEAVKNACEVFKEAGAKRALLLPVSVPSHTPLMRPAAAKLGLYLDKVHWKPLNTPVIFNVDTKLHADRYGIEAALGAQLYQPVLWAASILKLVGEGVTACIEVGPGKILTGLNKRIDSNLSTTAFNTPEALENVCHLVENT